MLGELFVSFKRACFCDTLAIFGRPQVDSADQQHILQQIKRLVTAAARIIFCSCHCFCLHMAHLHGLALEQVLLSAGNGFGLGTH